MAHKRKFDLQTGEEIIEENKDSTRDYIQSWMDSILLTPNLERSDSQTTEKLDYSRQKFPLLKRKNAIEHEKLPNNLDNDRKKLKETAESNDGYESEELYDIEAEAKRDLETDRIKAEKANAERIKAEKAKREKLEHAERAKQALKEQNLLEKKIAFRRTIRGAYAILPYDYAEDTIRWQRFESQLTTINRFYLFEMLSIASEEKNKALKEFNDLKTSRNLDPFYIKYVALLRDVMERRQAKNEILLCNKALIDKTTPNFKHEIVSFVERKICYMARFIDKILIDRFQQEGQTEEDREIAAKNNGTKLINP